MRFSEARHEEVVSTATATKVARLEGFVVLPAPGRIAALRLGKVQGDGDLLDWGDLTAFGRDAITIPDPGAIHRPRDETQAALSSQERDLPGKTVLTELGQALGSVVDVDFDPATGAVTAVITDRAEIPGRLLMGVGSYAVVVAVEPS